MTENYYIGQTFEGKYPPMAACWCNMNNAHIEANGNIYTIVENAGPSEAEIIAQQVAELKAELSSTDYVVIKIAEATGEEADTLREKYAQVIADRKNWREQINNLENKQNI